MVLVKMIDGSSVKEMAEMKLVEASVNTWGSLAVKLTEHVAASVNVGQVKKRKGMLASTWRRWAENLRW